MKAALIGLWTALAVACGGVLQAATAPRAATVQACPDIIQHPARYSRDFTAAEWRATDRCVMGDGVIVMDHGRYTYNPSTHVLRDWSK
jgi:hypothetical protein